MILLERWFPGVKCRKMPLMGQWSSGTAYVDFENVIVPETNLIGEENKGFPLIMSTLTFKISEMIQNYF